MLRVLSINSSVRRLGTSSRCLTLPWMDRNREIWTPDRIVKPIFDNIEIPNCTLAEYIWKDLDKWPTKTATVCGVTGKQYTYEQAYKLSSNFAANLRKKIRISDGDTVAVMLPNVPEYPIVFFGILAAGGVATTINSTYTAYEVSKQILLSDPKLVVTSPYTVNVIKEALKLSKRDIPIIVVRFNEGESVPETIDYSEFAEDNQVDKSVLKEVKRTADDVCVLPYSSGTTGLPKGVELTNRNLVANACQQNPEKLMLCRETTATHQDSVLANLPLFHSYGLSIIMVHKLSLGLKMVTLPRFQPKEYLDALLKYRINVIYAAPPTLLFLGSHPDVRSEHLEHIYSVTSGAAPLPSADIDVLFEKAQRKLIFGQGYGLTETSPLVTISPPDDEDYASVGWAIPNCELKIIDAENNPLGPNEVGELLVRGPNVMKGYRNNEQANKEVFTKDNFFKTGDAAKIDESGKVHIVERIKELIKVKGFQVPPAELESVLREHEDVMDAAVTGIIHPTYGEIPKAFVVVKEGRTIGEDKLLEFVAERVAPYKRIKQITFMDSIPKNASGKILRRLLKEK